MNNSVVRCDHLAVSYGKSVALVDVSTTIDQQMGVVGLFGPNGAGKSTFMRVICGDLGRYTGLVEAPERSEIAYLPDAPFLYHWLTVKQCSQLWASRYPDFRAEVFDHFLAGSKVAPDLRVKALSKGMSERLHLALTMARAPKLYVLDEPLGGVDPVTRDLLLGLIQQYRAPETPVLLSTHLINGVEQIFNYIKLINDGEVIASAPVDEVRQLGDGNLEAAYKKLVLQK